MMDEARFWRVIDESRAQAQKIKRKPHEDFLTVHERTLAAVLKKCSPKEIAAFDDRFWELHRRAYQWNLWAAAYWLLGGCGDDGFTDFRASIISLGEDLYGRILKDPDTLADIVDLPNAPYLGAEGFQYVAAHAYKEKTGHPMPETTAASGSGRQEPSGKRVDHDDKELMRRHFPKLVAKFPDMGD